MQILNINDKNITLNIYYVLFLSFILKIILICQMSVNTSEL